MNAYNVIEKDVESIYLWLLKRSLVVSTIAWAFYELNSVRPFVRPPVRPLIHGCWGIDSRSSSNGDECSFYKLVLLESAPSIRYRKRPFSDTWNHSTIASTKPSNSLIVCYRFLITHHGLRNYKNQIGWRSSLRSSRKNAVRFQGRTKRSKRIRVLPNNIIGP